MRFPLFQEQIAACHEFDGVRKEKERLTAAYWSRELQLLTAWMLQTSSNVSAKPMIKQEILRNQ